jgi:glycosyltransferase involved in cell wall biosynthesis
MKIAIDFRIKYNNDRALSVFTTEFWQDMAVLKSDHGFIFITGEGKPSDQLTKNTSIQKLGRNNIKWLDQKKLDKALFAWQADCFITMHENGFRINHLFNKKGTNKKFFQTDEQVMFLYNAEEQMKKTGLPEPVISVIKPACGKVITALSWTEAESIKTQYTGDRSFFLFIGNISEQHQLVELLKAFSIFKKWQQSNMQLVIAGYTTKWAGILEEKLQTYKYKSDVVIIKNATSTEIAKLLGACYAALYPVAENIFPLGLLWAIQSNKAVIASDNYINRQITEKAEWVEISNTAEGFAKAMILLYKDEKHQQLLVQQTIEPARQFNRGQMLAEVWARIEK